MLEFMSWQSKYGHCQPVKSTNSLSEDISNKSMILSLECPMSCCCLPSRASTAFLFLEGELGVEFSWSRKGLLSVFIGSVGLSGG